MAGKVTAGLAESNSVIYRASAGHIQPLQNVLNVAQRIILHKRKFDRITADVRDQLHWLPVQQRIEYKVCVLVYKCLHQAAPTYLSELCMSSASRSHLRSAACGEFAVPRSRTSTYGQRSFAVSGPTLWNSLPLAAKCSRLAFNPNSVLYASEDCSVQWSLRNVIIAPP